MKPYVITHRGLDPSRENYYPESSIEAFADQLSRGYGIEFDPNFVKDGIVINHDRTLERITNFHDDRAFSEITIQEAVSIEYGQEKRGHLPSFEELMDLISQSAPKVHAMHLKGRFQNKYCLDRLIDSFNAYPRLFNSVFIFDVKVKSATYIKKHLPRLKLASSVAHPYDIKRYNKAVNGTLMRIDDAIAYRHLYDWVLLDEWDLTDKNKGIKYLHTENNYEKLRNAKYNIALVTPELHGTSPGLLGGETHPDAKSMQRLMGRIKKIIALKPDAIITDNPEDVRELVQNAPKNTQCL
jgi:glycerophosphoryl diester phosphodiesterase